MKKKVLIIIALILLISAIAFVVAMRNPRTLPGITGQSKQQAYNTILPGSTRVDTVQQQLGSPLRTEQANTETNMVYSAGQGNRPLSITIDGAGVTSIIKVPLGGETAFDDASKDLEGQPIVLYGPFTDLGYQLYVYLPSGVALVANPETNHAQEKWFFPIVTKEEFLKKFTPEYSEVKPEQERE